MCDILKCHNARLLAGFDQFPGFQEFRWEDVGIIGEEVSKRGQIAVRPCEKHQDGT